MVGSQSCFFGIGDRDRFVHPVIDGGPTLCSVSCWVWADLSMQTPHIPCRFMDIVIVAGVAYRLPSGHSTSAQEANHWRMILKPFSLAFSSIKRALLCCGGNGWIIVRVSCKFLYDDHWLPLFPLLCNAGDESEKFVFHCGTIARPAVRKFEF